MSEKKKITVAIADDHSIFRDGLRLAFSESDRHEVVGESANGKELVELYDKLRPDVVLTDIAMPVMDGVQATRAIIEMNPHASIIALSMYEDEKYVAKVMEAGARGYLSKHVGRLELLHAVDAVNANKYYIGNGLSKSLLVVLAQVAEVQPDEFVFNETELNIIKCTCRDMTSQEMGEELRLSSRTIEGHRARIMEKLKVKSKVGIALFAIKTKLVDLDDI